MSERESNGLDNAWKFISYATAGGTCPICPNGSHAFPARQSCSASSSSITIIAVAHNGRFHVSVAAGRLNYARPNVMAAPAGPVPHTRAERNRVTQVGAH